MRLSVVVMFEKGRPRGRDQITRTTAVVGDLQIEYRHDARRNRAIRVAHLRDPADAEEDMLPPLEGAELVGMTDVAFTLAGVEQVDGSYVAQTWLVRTAPSVRVADPSTMHPATRRRIGS